VSPLVGWLVILTAVAVVTTIVWRLSGGER